MNVKTIGFKSILDCYAKTKTIDIPHTKEVLNLELMKDTSSHLNLEQKREIKEIIKELNNKNEMTVIHDILSKIDQYNERDKNSQNIFSMIADTITDFMDQEDFNSFVLFENLVENYLYVQPESARELCKILLKDFDKMENSIFEQYPNCTESQIKSIMHQIDLKIDFINKAKSNHDIMEGLKGIKIVIDHNLKGKNKITSRETDLLFLNATFKAFANSPEDHPEWCYFLSKALEVFPYASENDIKLIFSKLMEGAAFELKDAVDSPTVNPYYLEAFELMYSLDKDHVMFLDIRPDFTETTTDASLTSGGVQVSYFTRHEHRVLETTKVGDLFEHFRQHPTENVQLPLWFLLCGGFIHSEITLQNKDPVVIGFHYRASDQNALDNLIKMITALRVSKIELGSRKLELHLSPLISNSYLEGGFESAKKIIISLTGVDLEEAFKAANPEQAIKKIVVQQLRNSIGASLGGAFESIAKNKIPTVDEILRELKKLGKSPKEGLAPEELEALKRDLVLQEAIGSSKDPELINKWNLIK